MSAWTIVLVLLLSYLAGSIPSGWLIVKIATGKDVREIESGRTGGTNAMRAAGWFAGVLTAGMDIFKGIATAWIVNWFMPGDVWLQVFAAAMAIVGHNYSIFLMERNQQGKLRLRGGAGGATALGGAIALWPQVWLVILPLGLLVYLVIGYASITTISVPSSQPGFCHPAISNLSPWTYVLYGIIAQAMLIGPYARTWNVWRAGPKRAVGFGIFHQEITTRLSHPARPVEARYRRIINFCFDRLIIKIPDCNSQGFIF
jgi:glycerol-3-phosphate acyltransferase PlsY